MTVPGAVQFLCCPGQRLHPGRCRGCLSLQMPPLPCRETIRPRRSGRRPCTTSVCACSVHSSNTSDSLERQYIQCLTPWQGWKFGLVGSSHGWLGGLLLAPATWVLAARDVWLIWDDASRGRHLDRVIGRRRFLIRPSVSVRCLASRVLGMAVRRVGGDFEAACGIRPVLAETLVAPEHRGGWCGARRSRRVILPDPATPCLMLFDTWNQLMASLTPQETQRPP